MIFQIYALGIELYFYANSPTVLENQCGCTPNCKRPFICTKKLSLAKAYMIAFWWKSGLDENMPSWNVYGTKKEASIFREWPPSLGYWLQAALTKKAQCINKQWSLYKSWCLNLLYYDRKLGSWNSTLFLCKLTLSFQKVSVAARQITKDLSYGHDRKKLPLAKAYMTAFWWKSRLDENINL